MESLSKRSFRVNCSPRDMELWNSVIQLGKGVKSGTAGIDIAGFLIRSDSADANSSDNADFNATKIREMKDYLTENTITLPCLTDFYLQRFLNARLFNVPLSARLARMYNVWRESEDCGKFPNDVDGVRALLESSTMAIFREGSNSEPLLRGGKYTVLVRPGNWNPRELPGSDALKAASIAVEPLSFDKHRSSTLVIIDMTDVGVDHVSSMTPRLLNRIVFFIIECVPVYIDAVHIIYEPFLFRLLFAIFKQFMSEDAKKKVQFHGRGTGKLSQKVPALYLPPCLKGTAKEIDWLSHINSEPVKRGYHQLGYDIGVG